MVTPSSTSMPAARPQYSSVLRIMPLESWNTVA
jgi:hypothetical protein